jgi:hypothetical protein
MQLLIQALRRAVWYKGTNVSEEPDVCIFRVKFLWNVTFLQDYTGSNPNKAILVRA